MQRFWRKTPFAAITLIAILCAGGVAFATSDDGATGKSAQEPLGTLSASPDTGDDSRVLGQEGSGGGDNAGSAGASGAGGGNPGGSTGGGDSKLPFSGFVAIPLLVAGAGLLVTGVGLRRRAVRTATS
jgi:hypothetical protein